MSSARAQLRKLVGFVSRRHVSSGTDRSVAREFAWSGEGLPTGLALQWLGTSGFRLTYEGYSVVIDPYLTRVPLSDLLLARARPTSTPLVDRHIPGKVDAVLVGHTHFDHAFDTPYLSKRDNCKVYGSRSLGALMGLYGLVSQWVDVEHYHVYEIGPFEVTFVPSLHSKVALGLTIPFKGDICCAHFDQLTPSAYACGQVYGIHIRVAGVTFYHQGSADLIEDAIRHSNVDYFLAGIAGRGFTKNYTERISRLLGPRVVVPHHFDNFFTPLNKPMKFSFNVNLSGFIEEVQAVSQDFEIRSLDLLQEVTGNPPLDASRISDYVRVHDD